MNIEPTFKENLATEENKVTDSNNLKTEGATKLYKDTNDILRNGKMKFIVLDQNDEDTILQQVDLDDDGKVINKHDYFVVAWGLQKDGSWNQGHYYTTLSAAQKGFKDRAKQRVTEAKADDFQAFLSKAKENTTAKTIVAIANKYGYRCRTPYIANFGEVMISMMPQEHYLPDVYYTSYDDGSGQFMINNSSYGSLDLSTYAKVVECCQNALKMCQELSAIDVTSLEVEPK